VKGLRPDKWATTRVEDVMAKPPRLPVVGKDDSLVVAVERLQRSGLDGLPVVDDGRLVGVLTRRSIGLAVQARTARDANTDGRSSAPDETGRNDTTE
jgi:predicted transcriptional regulator